MLVMYLDTVLGGRNCFSPVPPVISEETETQRLCYSNGFGPKPDAQLDAVEKTKIHMK